jgi:hypothetical protein
MVEEGWKLLTAAPRRPSVPSLAGRWNLTTTVQSPTGSVTVPLTVRLPGIDAAWIVTDLEATRRTVIRTSRAQGAQP